MKVDEVNRRRGTRQSTLATGRCPEVALTRNESSTPAPDKRGAGVAEFR